MISQEDLVYLIEKGEFKALCVSHSKRLKDDEKVHWSREFQELDLAKVQAALVDMKREVDRFPTMRTFWVYYRQQIAPSSGDPERDKKYCGLCMDGNIRHLIQSETGEDFEWIAFCAICRPGHLNSVNPMDNRIRWVEPAATWNAKKRASDKDYREEIKRLRAGYGVVKPEQEAARQRNLSLYDPEKKSLVEGGKR